MSQIQINLLSPEEFNHWDCYVKKHPQSTPYHLFAWQTAVKDAYGHTPYYLVARRNQVIRGVLPLVRMPHRGFFSGFVGLPFCDTGAVLADNDEIADKLILSAIKQCCRLKNDMVEIRQHYPLSSNARHHLIRHGKVRMTLNLPQDSQTLWEKFPSKLRSQIRKAMKNKLIFKWSDVSHLNDFYNVFSHNMRDLGSPVHSRKWIKSVLTAYHAQARIGLVYFDEKAVGCGLMLFMPNMACIPWASTLQTYNSLAPNMLLYWEFLKFAADNGCRCFDFGRSTLNEGTYRFKKQWGAKPRELYWYQFFRSPESPPQDTVPEDAHYRTVLERLWMRMPLNTANFFGPMLRKYISL